MPGLWTVSLLGNYLETRYKMRHPKPNHFRIREDKGLLGMGRSGGWWINHKNVSLSFGPFESRAQAERVLPLVVGLMELANPKLKEERVVELEARLAYLGWREPPMALFGLTGLNIWLQQISKEEE